MLRKLVIPAFSAMVFLLQGCGSDSNPTDPTDPTNPGPTPVSLTSEFASDLEGWVAGFADYPVGEEGFFELQAEYSALPAPLDQGQGSFKVTGNNHSDDLFMYITKKLTGLAPETFYDVTFNIEFATDAPTDVIGVGGAPGTSVYVKTGAVSTEPVREVDAIDHYRMALDKGNQSSSGADMITIGDFSNGTSEDFSYRLKTLSNTVPFEALSNEAGEVWVIIGVDSGFEARTTIYYNRINLSLE